MHQFNAPLAPGGQRGERDHGVVSYHSDPLKAKKYRKQNALSRTSKAISESSIKTLPTKYIVLGTKTS